VGLASQMSSNLLTGPVATIPQKFPLDLL